MIPVHPSDDLLDDLEALCYKHGMTTYDDKQHRQSRRQQRQRGCHIYIPAEVLKDAGIDVDDPPPAYKLWGRARGSVLVRLYKTGVPA